MFNVLIPHDLTGTAPPRLKGARTLAKACKGMVHLVEFLPEPTAGFRDREKTVFELGYGGQEILNAQVLKQHKEDLEKLASQWRADGIEAQARIVDDHFDAGLKKYIRKHEIDLIAIQKPGPRNWLEVIRGTRADRAIEHTDCPVLTMHDPLDLSRLEELVLAVDLMQDYAPGSWTIIGQLAQCLDLKTSFLYVKEDIDDAVKLNNLVFDFVQKHGFESSPAYFVRSEDIEEGIVRFAERHSDCMVATMTGASGGLLRIFANSVSEGVVQRADMPVLTINRQD